MGREPTGEIVIHTGPNWMRWAPLDIDTKGLGGSETAAVRLAEALAAQGWVVTVYGDVEERCKGNVVYRHNETFDPVVRRDVFISSRMPEMFDWPVNAQTKLLWMHDTDCGDRLTPGRGDRIDHVLALSAWHRDYLEWRYPQIRGKVVQIRNGINLEAFAGLAPKRTRRVVFTSSPERGLDVLLEMWPEIRRRAWGAILEFAYAPVYYRIAEQVPLVGRHAETIRRLADQPGVTNLGSLSQPRVAKLMRESLVWAHPCYSTPYDVPFYETSCIGAMEAQAAGCHVVASNWGALPETVQVGSLIDAEPRSEAWKARFVESIVLGLTNEELQRDAQQNGPKAAARLGWDGVATAVTKIAAERAGAPAPS